MGKYIIEVGDAYAEYVCGKGDMLCLPVRINEFEDNWLNTDIPLTPYTEPDMEKIRNESFKNGYDAACKDIDIKSKTNAAYRKGYQDTTVKISSDEQAIAEKAYQSGLNDAWEAARKICLNESDGGLSGITVHDIFNTEHYRDALRDYTSAKAIEKIRQYEQEKEEIKVGDEVRNIENGWIAVVCNIEGECMTLMDTNGALGDGYHVNRFTKTGRRFPEIAAVLAKMKEES